MFKTEEPRVKIEDASALEQHGQHAVVPYRSGDYDDFADVVLPDVISDLDSLCITHDGSNCTWYDPPPPRMKCLYVPEPPHRRQPAKTPGTRVYVPVSQEVYENSDSRMRELLESWILTNIVCTARLSNQHPIEGNAWILHGTYIRSVFPSCIGSSKSPSASWTLFRQGYIRCAGGQTREWAQELIMLIQFRLYIELGMPFRIYNFSVQNIVSAATYNDKLVLERLHDIDQSVWKFEGDLFPGMIHRMDDPKVVMQIFDSGKLNVVGAKWIHDSLRALRKVEPSLRVCRLQSFTLTEEERNGHSLASLQERDIGPVDNYGEPEFDAPPETRPWFVESAIKRWWRSKKVEKLFKESAKRRRNESKALNDRKSELKKAIQKRLKNNQGKAKSAAKCKSKKKANSKSRGAKGRKLQQEDEDYDDQAGESDLDVDLDDVGRSADDAGPLTVGLCIPVVDTVMHHYTDDLRSLQRSLEDIEGRIAALPAASDMDNVENAAVLEYVIKSVEPPERTFRVEIQYNFTVNVMDAADESELERAKRAVLRLLGNEVVLALE